MKSVTHVTGRTFSGSGPLYINVSPYLAARARFLPSSARGIPPEKPLDPAENTRVALSIAIPAPMSSLQNKFLPPDTRIQTSPLSRACSLFTRIRPFQFSNVFLWRSLDSAWRTSQDRAGPEKKEPFLRFSNSQPAEFREMGRICSM